MATEALKYPSTLATDSNRFGNQFMALYINTDTVKEEEQDEFRTIKALDGTRLTGQELAKYYSNKQFGNSLTITPTPQTGRKTSKIIYLPVPTNIATNFGVDYTDLEFGNEALKLAMSAGGAMSDLAEKYLNAAAPIAGGIAGKAASLVKEAAIYGLKVEGFRNKLALNPHKELLFQGPRFREFDFNWKLIAKNQEESEGIKNIINELKYHMHPTLVGGGYLYKYPSDFNIQFWRIDKDEKGKTFCRLNTYLSKIATSVITSLEVDYSGGGEYATFRNTGAPVEIDLKIRFKETVLITKDLISDVFNEHQKEEAPMLTGAEEQQLVNSVTGALGGLFGK